MVAIVTGSGLGLFNSSRAVLGEQGSVGNATLGQGNEGIYVNAATGNLVIQQQDEFLVTQGLDTTLLSTYNSQGLMNDDNGDNWRLNIGYLYSLSGTANTANSTIRRISGDGCDTLYEFNTSLGLYVSTDGEGAHDTISNDIAMNTWTWTDGSTGLREVYGFDTASNTYRLVQRLDLDGNPTSYIYNAAGDLSTIVDTSGQGVVLNYYAGTRNLSSIEVYSDTHTTRVSYQYDTLNRLTDFVVDLTPENTADSSTYITSYTYDGNSKRVASITQSDGTTVSFGYEQVGTTSVYRVKTLTDGLGKITTFSYDAEQIAVADLNVLQDTKVVDAVDYPLDQSVLDTTDTVTTTVDYVLDETNLKPGYWQDTPALLDTLPGGAYSSQIATDNAGNAIAVWTQHDGTAYSIYSNRYTAGIGWAAEPELLETNVGAADSPQLVVDGVGNAIVVWRQFDGVSYSLYANRYLIGENKWQGPELLETSDFVVSSNQISVDAMGNVTVVWMQYTGTAFGIYAKQYMIVDGWHPVETVATTNSQVAPSIATDAQGNFMVGWTAYSSATDTVYSYARVYRATGGWQVPELLMSLAVDYNISGNGLSVANFAFDEQGNAIAIGVDIQDGYMFTRRYVDGVWQGVEWFENYIGSSEYASVPKISFDHQGNAIAVWSQPHLGDLNNFDVYTKCLIAGAWQPTDLIEIGTGVDNAKNPDLAFDVNGNAIVVWQQDDGTGSRIYSRKYSAGQGWSPEAERVGNATGASDPRIVIDGAGNPIVIWAQRDDATTYNIYASRYQFVPAYLVQAGDTWSTIAQTLYHTSNVADELQAVLGNVSLIPGRFLSNLPATLADTVTTIVTVAPYYTIQVGDTWASIAQTLYHTSNVADELQAALNDIPLSAGQRLTALPASLTDTASAVVTVAPYYVVQAGDTWASIAEFIYGDVAVANALQSALGSPALLLGTELTVPLTLIYHQIPGAAGTNVTDVTDSLGNVTRYTYDSNNRLTEIRTPAVNGTPISTKYSYDTDGNVSTITDGRNNVITYQYDSNGNVVLSRDAAGNTVTRTYNSNNQITSESRYTMPDSDGAGPALPGNALTTNYVYDIENHLRFLISPEGRVTEYRYNTVGQRISEIQYTGGVLTSLDALARRNASLDFDGIDDVVTFVNPNLGTGDITINTWINTDSLVSGNNTWGGNGIVRSMAHTDGVQGDYVLSVDMNGAVHFSYWQVPGDNVTGRVYVDSNNANNTLITAGQWYQVTATVNYVNGNAVRKLYINGVLQTTNTTNTETQWEVGSAIGRSYDDSTSYFDGKIDNVRLYTGALSAADIVSLYTNDNASLTTATLRSSWQFNETTGTTAANSVSGAPDGTLINMATTAWTSSSLMDTDINSWIDTQNKSSVIRTDYAYDFRGLLSSATQFNSVDVNGVGNVNDAANSVTRYVYDQRGQLLQKIDPRAASNVLWQQDFNADTSTGLTTLPAGYMAVSGGRLVLTTQQNATDTWPAIYSTTSYAASEQLQYRGEITTTNDVTDRRAILGMDGTTSAGVNRRHAAYIIDGNLYVHYYDNGWKATQLGAIKSNATYVVEVGLTATGSRLYVYEKGTSRDVGFIDDKNFTDWNTTRLAIQGYGKLNGVATQVFIDNLSISRASSSRYATYTTNYVYDGLGRLLSSVDAQGVTVTTNYLDSLSIKQRIYSNGQREDYLYNKNGQLYVNYHYNQGNLQSLTVNQYDSLGRLRMVMDEAGHLTHILYDNANRPVMTINAEGEVTETAYDAAGNVIAEVGYARRLSALTLTALSSDFDLVSTTLAALRVEAGSTLLPNRATHYIYDNANRLGYTLKRDQNSSDTAALRYAATQNFYDGAGRLTDEKAFNAFILLNTDLPGKFDLNNIVGTQPTVTEISNVLLLKANGTSDRLTRHFYNNDGQQIATLDGEGYLVEYVYNNAGQLKQTLAYASKLFQIDVQSTGTLQEIKGWITASAEDQKSTYYYNGRGQLVGQVDVDGYLTEYKYDLAGNREETKRHSTRVNNYSLLTGNETLTSISVSIIVDQRTITHHDALNRIDYVVEYRNGNLLGVKTAYEYNDVGLLVRTSRGLNTSDVRTTQARYDIQGRLIGELTAQGSAAIVQLSNTLTVSQRTTAVNDIWNQYGLKHTYDAVGRRTSTTDQLGHVRNFYYDNANRLRYTLIVNPVTNRAEVQETVYNSFGQVSDTVQYDGTLDITGINLVVQGFDYIDGLVKGIANTILDSRTTTNYTLRGAIASILKGETVATEEQKYFYNAFGEVRRSARDFVDGSHEYLWSYYDRRGQVTSTSHDTYGAGTSTYIGSDTIYDAFGRVIQASDGNVHSQYYDYSQDTNGRLVIVSDDLGQLGTTTYDAFNRVIYQTDGFSKLSTIYYSYDGDGTESVDVYKPGGIEIYTTTNSHGEVIAQYDGNWNLTAKTYDKNGNVLTETDGEGNVTSYAYDAANNLTQATNAKGVITKYDYDHANRLTKITIDPTGLNLVTEYRYDAKGQHVQTIAPNGSITKTAFDHEGRIIATIKDEGGLNLQTTYSFDSAGNTLTMTQGADTVDARTTQYIYDGLNRRVKEIADPTTATHIGLNLVTQYVYDDNNNVIAKIEGAGTTSVITTRYLYDERNRQTYVIDGEGGVSHSVYDANNNVIKSIRYSTAINTALLPTVETPLFEATIQSLLGGTARDTSQDRVQRYIYSQANRLFYSIDAEGAVIRRYFDANGNVTQTLQYAIALTAEDLINVDANPILSTLNGLVNTTAKDHTQDRSTYAVYDHNDRLLYSIDALKYITEYAYDNIGQLIQTTQYANAYAGAVSNVLSTNLILIPGNLVANTAEDRTTRYVYDKAGRQTFVIDALGFVTEKVYDNANNVVDTIRYANAIPMQDNVPIDNTTKYIYDSVNNLFSTGAGHSITLNPGAYKDLTPIFIGATFYSNTAQVNEYTMTFDIDTPQNWHGEVNIPTLAAGTYRAVITIYDNDASYSHRTTTLSITVSANGDVTRVQHAPTLNEIYKLLVENTEQDQHTKMVYDAAGRARYQIDARNYVTENQYDARGNIIKTTRYNDAIASAAVTTTVADVQDALQARTAPVTANDQTTRFVYDTVGHLVFSIDAAGAVTKNTYDTVGNVIKTQAYATVLTAQLISLDGAADRLAYISSTGVITEDALNDRVTRYAYDKDNRLVYSVDAMGSVTRQIYDALGNVIQKREYPTALNSTQLINLDNAIDCKAYLQTNVLADDTATSKDRVTHYAYDHNGRVVLSIDPMLAITEQSYDAFGNVEHTRVYATALTLTQAQIVSALTAATDRSVAMRSMAIVDGTNDRITTFVYNKNQQLQEQTTFAGTKRFLYNAFGNITDIIDPRGVELAEQDTVWAKAERVRLGYAELVSDPAFTLQQQTAVLELYTTHQEFDQNNRQTVSVSATNGRTETQYDAFGNIVKLTDANGGIGYFYYNNKNQVNIQVDTMGYATQMIYDAFGNAIETIKYANKVTGTYNENTMPGIVASAADAASKDQHSYAFYDTLNRTTQITDAEENIENFTYDAFGNVKTHTNKNRKVTNYDHDRNGNKVAEYLPVLEGATDSIVNRYEYNAFNELKKTIDAFGLTEQRVTEYFYDNSGRVTETVEPQILTDTGLQTPHIYKSYDAAGNVITETDAKGFITHQYYDASNRRIATIDAEKYLHVFTYDAIGNRIAERVYADQIYDTITTTFPDINTLRKAITQPFDTINYRETIYRYDAGNHVVEQSTRAVWIYDHPNNFRQQSLTTTYTNDHTGNVVMVTDARGNKTYMYYDHVGNRTMQVDALGYVTKWDYDANGNVLTETRYAKALEPSVVAGLTTASKPVDPVSSPGGYDGDRITTYTYDGMNRRKTETLTNVAFNTVEINIGAPTSWVGNAVTQYQYDAMGNRTVVIAADNGTSNYTYDALNRLTREQGVAFTDFEGATVRTTNERQYDAVGNVIAVINKGKTADQDQISRYQYDAHGNLIKETDAEGHPILYYYDLNGNVTKKTTQHTSPDPVPVVTLSDSIYKYNKLNQQTSIQDVAGGLNVYQTAVYNAYGEVAAKGNTNDTGYLSQVEYFEYDFAGRLVKTNQGDGVWRAYLYDANGNQTAQIQSANIDIFGNDLSVTGYAYNEFDIRSHSIEYIANTSADIVQRTESEYDTRNQLINTYQAKINDGVTTGVDTVSSQWVDAMNDPFLGGTIIAANCTVGQSAVYYSFTVPGMGTFSGYRVRTEWTPLLGYGDGNLVVRYKTSTDSAWSEMVVSGEAAILSGDLTTPAYQSSTVTVQLIKKTLYGDILLSQYTAMSSSTPGITTTLNKLHLTGQQLAAKYIDVTLRRVSDGLVTTYSNVPRLVNSGGSSIDGWYTLDWSALNIPADQSWDYEYEFFTKTNTSAAVEGSGGNVLEHVKGTLTLGANPTINTKEVLTWQSAHTDTSAVNTIARSQTFNAFGEISSEIDSRGNAAIAGASQSERDALRNKYTTTFVYNTRGQLVDKFDPLVDATNDHGTINQNIRPATHYYYNLLGQTVGERTLNSNYSTANPIYNYTTQTLDAVGHAMRVYQGGALNGAGFALLNDLGVKKYQYDVFGNMRYQYDELDENYRTSHRTTYTYNKMNQLVRVDHPTVGGFSNTDNNGSLVAPTTIGTYSMTTLATLIGGQGMAYDGTDWHYGSNDSWQTYNGSSWISSSAPDEVSDISAATFLADPTTSGSLNLSFGFNNNYAVNGTGADLVFFFLYDQSANSANVTINGVTQSLSFQNVYNSSGQQQVVDGVNWDGIQQNNVLLMAAQLDLSDFGLLNGEAVMGPIDISLTSNSSTPVVLSLVGALHPSAVSRYDSYGYDEMGNRISHTNALNETEKTYYDNIGRVIKTVSYGGIETSYQYTTDIYTHETTMTTTQADGKTLVDIKDYFGKLLAHKDLGNQVFAYHYNRAGWLTEQLSASDYYTGAVAVAAGLVPGEYFYTGQNIKYSYYHNGLLKETDDTGVHTKTRYEYDANGNRTLEAYYQEGGLYYQWSQVTYDALNRVTLIKDSKYEVTYEYDAAGNRRHVLAQYHDGVTGAEADQDYWYAYDNANRFTVTKGSRNDTTGLVEAGATGYAITYNADNTRATSTYNGVTESYGYAKDGMLETVTIDSHLRAQRLYDAVGNVLDYTEKNDTGATTRIQSTRYFDDLGNYLDGKTYSDKTQVFGTDASTNTSIYSYNADNSLALVFTTQTAGGQTTTYDLHYTYEYWDGAKQKSIQKFAHNSNVNGEWKPGFSQFEYDVNGHLTKVSDEGSTIKRYLRYKLDSDGRILQRNELIGAASNRTQNYYYLNGIGVGDAGSFAPGGSQLDYTSLLNGRDVKPDKYPKPVSSADFDYNFMPVNDQYPATTPGTFSVTQNGMSLQSVALAVWGDSTLWYLIEDANGLNTAVTPLVEGQVLVIPNVVTNIHNNSSTFKVYNPGELIGDTTPTLPDPPPPPKPSCAKQVLVMVVVIVVSAYLGPLIAESFATAAAGIGAAAGLGTIGMTALTYAGAALGAGLGAALGNLAGQEVSRGLGMIDHVDKSSLRNTFKVEGILAALTGMPAKPSVYDSTRRAFLREGVSEIVIDDYKFDWHNISAAAISSPLSSGFNQLVDGPGFMADLTRGVVNNTANSYASYYTHGHEDAYKPTAASIFGNALGSAYATYLMPPDPYKNSPQKGLLDWAGASIGGMFGSDASDGLTYVHSDSSQIDPRLMASNDPTVWFNDSGVDDGAESSYPPILITGNSRSDGTLFYANSSQMESDSLSSVPLADGSLLWDSGAISTPLRDIQTSAGVPLAPVDVNPFNQLDRVFSATSASYSDGLIPLASNIKSIDPRSVLNDLPEGVTVNYDANLHLYTINHAQSGYQAMLIKDKNDGAYYLSNRGTEFNSGIQDGITDVVQAQGLYDKQYDIAAQLGKKLYNQLSGNLTFTGHSLGGGLAALQALLTGGNAITYNAAGVHTDTIARFGGSKILDGQMSQHITNYHVNGEILTTMQTFNYLDVVSAVYFTIPKNVLELKELVSGRNVEFGISYVPEALGRQIELPAIGLNHQPISGNIISLMSPQLHGRDYIQASINYSQQQWNMKHVQP